MSRWWALKTNKVVLLAKQLKYAVLLINRSVSIVRMINFIVFLNRFLKPSFWEKGKKNISFLPMRPWIALTCYSLQMFFFKLGKTCKGPGWIKSNLIKTSSANDFSWLNINCKLKPFFLLLLKWNQTHFFVSLTLLTWSWI